MSRKSVMRKRRKELPKWSNGRYHEEVLNLDDDNKVIQDRKQWGYCVECFVNGYSIGAPDWNRFESIHAAWIVAKRCLKKPSGVNFGIEEESQDE